jgi:PAS domain S-box-containing protein
MSPNTNNPLVAKVLLRQPIGSVRLVIALFTITAAVTNLLYDYFLPNLNDLDALRWTIIGLGCVVFAATYVRYKRAVIVTYSSFFLYTLTLLYVIAFAVINQFNPHAVTILILVVGASTVIINNLAFYGVQCFVIILTSLIAYSGTSLGSENMIAFLNLIIALGVFGIVITVRLKLISSVHNSQSSLEKLNVLSIVANKAGEIVFVSPSVKGLLGYEPKELVKEGWWSAHNLQDGWISREYILNYPNILPKEVASMETKISNKEGKTVWLNWVNSMLPNGNYIGIALDITKYKAKTS